MIMKKKIFVIDDEKDIQDILRINLEHNNYEVYTYSSAEEARKSLKKISRPDSARCHDGRNGWV